MRHLPLVLAAVLAAAPAAAQSAASPLSRADIGGSVGWFNANKKGFDEDRYNDWYNRSLHGGLGAGWYWTDNFKTEFDLSATSEATLRAYPRVIVDGIQTATPIKYSIGTKKLAVSQHYQGFRNRWVHPYAGVGVETTWERTTEEHGATWAYDPVARTSRQVLPAKTIGPNTDVIVRPFGALGFKAYMTQRSFFRTEMRVAFRGGIDEFLLRFGFGFDLPGNKS